MTKIETAIAVFSNADAGAVAFFDKKGVGHAMTAEGALFKGGAALAALKDAALEAALLKAGNGRYRAASDILCAAFPAIGKAAEKLIGTPWANKSTMATLINAVQRAEYKERTSAGKLTKQAEARMLCSALQQLPAFKPEVAEGDVVENAAEQPATAE
jgi:hypothetical protein